ncbi:MAG TPA: putative metal-binding motif-containing protein [Myxococcota bacterium]|nr:putative metal-binding motif-containing protein [Myxococcota bacterium]
MTWFYVDDDNSEVYPDASEVCDGVDNDCDSLTDADDDSVDLSTATTWYADADSDGAYDVTLADLTISPSASWKSGL